MNYTKKNIQIKMSEKEFTKDEIVALKELAEEQINHNLMSRGQKTNKKPNVFPKGYTGPRSFAEAMAMKWDPHKREWSKR